MAHSINVVVRNKTLDLHSLDGSTCPTQDPVNLLLLACLLGYSNGKGRLYVAKKKNLLHDSGQEVGRWHFSISIKNNNTLCYFFNWLNRAAKSA